jgi:hypothetical protein
VAKHPLKQGDFNPRLPGRPAIFLSGLKLLGHLQD